MKARRNEDATRIEVRVTHDDFSLAEEYRAWDGDAGIGAIVAFVGKVRDSGNRQRADRVVQAMTLEHYPGMTERVLETLAKTAAQRWPLSRVLIVHRVGYLQAAEQIVLVMTASAHRSAAFAAAEYLIDQLKTNAPFWKKEHTQSAGQCAETWVEARASDERAAQRWEDR